MAAFNAEAEGSYAVVTGLVSCKEVAVAVTNCTFQFCDVQ